MASGHGGPSDSTDFATQLAEVVSGSRGSSLADALAPATLEELSRKLTAFKAECDDVERSLVDVLLHLLSDPIERMRLRAPAETYFSEEEEEILREIEGTDRR